MVHPLFPLCAQWYLLGLPDAMMFQQEGEGDVITNITRTQLPNNYSDALVGNQYTSILNVAPSHQAE